jgi:hypothetical protein
VSSIDIKWTDHKGEHRGFVITAGQAHVGHLVELILANCGTDITIKERPTSRSKERANV